MQGFTQEQLEQHYAAALQGPQPDQYTDKEGRVWDLMWAVRGRKECAALKKTYGKAFVRATKNKDATDMHCIIRLTKKDTGEEYEGLLRIDNTKNIIMAYEQQNKYATEK